LIAVLPLPRCHFFIGFSVALLVIARTRYLNLLLAL
jgi:hypothetical protein